ncbi:uncharacterized protein [Epargyreus clarus]|uniref:uncharacterized protein n=1 Tax=Epargyreus clarus TaxID=520877 RepID=UPI003C2AB77C
MDNEKLIELVRQYEFIYNSKHPKYMDNSRKEIAWKDIARQLQSTPACCKQRWQVLRDACRRALNKRKVKGAQMKTFKKWTYEDEMSFVIPYFGERKHNDTTENTCDDEGSADISNEFYCNTSDNANTEAGAYKPTEVEYTICYQGSEKSVEEHSSSPIQTRPHVQPKKTNAKNAIKKAKYRPVQTPSAILINKLLEKQNKIESQQEHDELDRFFLNMSETVKKFSPYHQAFAKNKIFSIISEMELQQLATSYPDDIAPSPQSSSPRDSVVYNVIPKVEYQ